MSNSDQTAAIMFLVAFFFFYLGLLLWFSESVLLTLEAVSFFFFFFHSFSISICISRIFRFLALIEVLCVRGFQNIRIQSLDLNSK